MYLYYFNTENGTSDKILVSEIVKVGASPRYKKLVVYVSEDSEICTARLNRSTIVVTHREEGKIWRRTFWLNDYDMDQARQIVADYTRAKKEELIRKLNRMGES